MHPTPKDAVNLWTAGFATSAVIQGLGLRWFARMAKWGYNDGWQREIAIWNIGTLTLIAALRRGDAEAPASDDEQARCSRRFLLGETSCRVALRKCCAIREPPNTARNGSSGRRPRNHSGFEGPKARSAHAVPCAGSGA